MESLIPKLSQLIAKARTLDNPELEVRLGRTNTQRSNFTPDVTYPYIHKLKQCMDASDHWTKYEELQYVNYFWPDGVRGTYNVVDAPIFIRKQNYGRIDVSSPNRSIDVRISLSEEVKAEMPTTPPECVRLVQRWSYEHNCHWRYDLSKTSMGPSKEKACSIHPLYEIELELNCKDIELDDGVLAHDLAEKITDLLGRYSEYFDPLPIDYNVVSAVTKTKDPRLYV